MNEAKFIIEKTIVRVKQWSIILKIIINSFSMR